MHSDVSHYDGLTYWGPIGVPKMEGLIDLMRLDAGATVVDIGCGRGELLTRLAERHGCVCVGIDRSAAALAQARGQLKTRALGMRHRLLQLDAADHQAPAASYAAAVWLGGPFLGGSYRDTVARLAE